jgi:hypothetical protein
MAAKGMLVGNNNNIENSNMHNFETNNTQDYNMKGLTLNSDFDLNLMGGKN